ncbi:MAG TPA: sugar phosphate isomerase/epimerase family protein [Syntrophales bacterium]|nr:sugar phosphate isomerase/epimerase family protein [Syntrophales bacterium]HOL58424.1 sugar phosphate isomerase/epimerase family protein [Syntrophales bacterium]HPO34593.1 sugar phosphate isomerase/epimerase family protein [Syntrophales bacterium]
MDLVSKKIMVHVPFGELHRRYLPLICERKLPPEISFDVYSLSNFSERDFRYVADKLGEAGLSVTFHAPFMDLRPGAVDPAIRQASVRRIEEVLSLVPLYRPLGIVCHPSFDRRYYVSTDELWLQNSIETWTYLSRRAEELGTVIALENVYEDEPLILARLLSAVNSTTCRFCFDTGHFNVFSRAKLEEWIEMLGDYLFEVHLHDNQGMADEHRHIGAGTFPFTDFFALLRKKGLHPLLTLEAHREDELWKSLTNLSEKMGA